MLEYIDKKLLDSLTAFHRQEEEGVKTWQIKLKTFGTKISAK